MKVVKERQFLCFPVIIHSRTVLTPRVAVNISKDRKSVMAIRHRANTH